MNAMAHDLGFLPVASTTKSGLHCPREHWRQRREDFVDSKETLRFLEETAERLRYIAVEIGAPDLLNLAKEIEREASRLEGRIKADEV